MAAVVALPSTERPVLKPARSMTYPLREAKGSTARRKPKQGEPFDPEELSRRLTAHVVEQKARAERRREARAAKAAATTYHHVPTVAAAAFERTTTPEVLRQIHKLAQPALKTHLELLHLEDSEYGYNTTSLRKTQAMDHAIIERDLLRTRNQFQWNHDMKEAIEVDIDRDIYKPPQRTFRAEASHLRSHSVNKALRPSSAGDLFSDEEEVHVTARPRTKPVHDAKDRNDWAQRDDDIDNRQQKKESSSPFLRKKEPSWIMKVKRERSVRQNKSDTVEADSGSPPEKVRTRFLARFKRHPS